MKEILFGILCLFGIPVFYLLGLQVIRAIRLFFFPEPMSETYFTASCDGFMTTGLQPRRYLQTSGETAYEARENLQELIHLARDFQVIEYHPIQERRRNDR